MKEPPPALLISAPPAITRLTGTPHAARIGPFHVKASRHGVAATGQGRSSGVAGRPRCARPALAPIRSPLTRPRAAGKAFSGRNCRPWAGFAACVIVAMMPRSGEELWRWRLVRAPASPSTRPGATCPAKTAFTWGRGRSQRRPRPESRLRRHVRHLTSPEVPAGRHREHAPVPQLDARPRRRPGKIRWCYRHRRTTADGPRVHPVGAADEGEAGASRPAGGRALRDPRRGAGARQRQSARVSRYEARG